MPTGIFSVIVPVVHSCTSTGKTDASKPFFLTLTDCVEFLYKVDNPYCPEADAGIRWDDPELKIQWNIDKPVLSEKDAHAPFQNVVTTGFENWS